jgi:hypothetical protein
MNDCLKYSVVAYALIASVVYCDATINYDVVSPPTFVSSAFAQKGSHPLVTTPSKNPSAGIELDTNLQTLALLISGAPKTKKIGSVIKSPITGKVTTRAPSSSETLSRGKSQLKRSENPAIQAGTRNPMMQSSMFQSNVPLAGTSVSRSLSSIGQ